MVPRLFPFCPKWRDVSPPISFVLRVYIYIYTHTYTYIYIYIFRWYSSCCSMSCLFFPSQCERSYPPHTLLFCDIPLTPLIISPSDPKIRFMYNIFFPWFHNCVADPSVLLCTWHSSWDSMIGLSKAAGDPWPETRQQHNQHTLSLHNHRYL